MGHYVSDLSHHKHSGYLVANSDMPGFTNRERDLIANLCRYHRKSLPTARHVDHRSLNDEDAQALLRLIPLLRMADSLDRSHNQRIQSMECRIEEGRVTLQLVSPVDIDLEQWAAERAGDVFRQIYGRPVELSRGVR